MLVINPSIRFDLTRLQRACDILDQNVRSYVLPGTVLAIANSNETILYKAFTSKHGEQTNKKSVFLLSSISQLLLATVIMQLVEGSILVLSHLLDYSIPEFVVPSRPTVVAWHLLTHTSGLDEIPLSKLLEKQPSYAEILQTACRSNLYSASGTRFEYSIFSFCIFAALITHLTRSPYPLYTRQSIFEPLGMNDTSYTPFDQGDEIPLHAEKEDQAIDRDKLTKHLILLTLPGEGLWRTAAVLITFGQTLLKSGRAEHYRLLSVAFICQEQARTAHYGLGGINPALMVHYLVRTLLLNITEPGYMVVD